MKNVLFQSIIGELKIIINVNGRGRHVYA